MMRISKNKKGFTLIELLIVMAIIAILIGISLPRFRGMQDEGQKTKARGNLATLRTAVEAYAAAPRRNGASMYPNGTLQNAAASPYVGPRTTVLTVTGWQYTMLMSQSPAPPAAQTVGTAGPIMLSGKLIDPFSATSLEYGYRVDVDPASGNICYLIWSDGTRGTVVPPTPPTWLNGQATVNPGNSIFITNGKDTLGRQSN